MPNEERAAIPLENIKTSDDIPTQWDLTNRKQRIRFLRAEDCLHTEINREKKVARYLSSHDYKTTYITTLNGCTCYDYQKRYSPCKHMYALAVECGVIDKDKPLFELPPDIEARLSQLDKNTRAPQTLNDLLDVACNLKEYSDIETKDGMWRVLHLKTVEFSMYKLRPLLDAGIIIRVNRNEYDFCDYAAQTLTVNQFKESARYVCPVIKFPPINKRELIEYVCSNHPEIINAIEKLCNHVAINCEYINHSQVIYDYLEDTYFDPIDKYVEYEHNYYS